LTARAGMSGNVTRMPAPSPPARLGVALAGLLAAVSLTGCGLGAGRAPSAIRLTVTGDFGARVLRSWSAPRVRGQETVMSLLLRNANVGTRYGGGFVQSIDGLAGGQERGEPVDWFYYVNGVQAPKGAAATKVHAGDHVWWDRHDWSQTNDVGAVVGSFPEPFLNGLDGKRLPVRVECAAVGGYACRTVTARLRALGVPAALAAGGTGAEPRTLRVIVAPWLLAKGDAVAGRIDRGPRASGVYARFSPDAKTLTLLDRSGLPTQTLTAGAGLIAAVRSGEDAPVWVVTGTDEAGVDHAARAFDEGELRDRFAVAFSERGTALPLPEVAG
jgi:uncharacterized protein DUF4430